MTRVLNTVATFTLGCRLNQADTALIHDRLRRAGLAIIGENENPDVIIINSCSVTNEAVRKTRQMVRRLKRRHPQAILAVTGCGTIVEKKYWADSDLPDVVIPGDDKKRILDHLAPFLNLDAPETSTPPTAPPPKDVFTEEAVGVQPFRQRAFVKIQEGCESFCAYCVVPYARGPERSRDWDEIIREVRGLIAAGRKEIVLTGVNICAYRFEKRGLYDLAATLADLPGEFRLRLSSTEPHPSNRSLIKLMTNHPKICRFLHLPLQHGTDEILRAMGRNYSTVEFKEFALDVVESIPGAHLGADVIVGLPGETDALFDQCAAFIESIPFANLHIFTYSRRPGTPAANFPNQVPKEIAKKRRQRLEAIGERASRTFTDSQIGQKLTILTEKELDDDQFEGWSDNYLKLRVRRPGLTINQFATIQVSTKNLVT